MPHKTLDASADLKAKLRTPQQQRTNASAVDDMVGNIRNLIAKESLSVGQRLPTEREFCDLYGASRNTVREALRILAAYGQVEVRPKVGATVADNRMTRVFDLFSINTIDISAETFADVQAFRNLLEVDPADLMIDRVKTEDIAELRELNAQLSTISDLARASEIDFQFHLRLVSILGNKTAHDVYHVLKPVIVRIMEKGKTCRSFMNETYNEHEDVLNALEAKDRLAFQYRLRSHLMMGAKHFGHAAESLQ
jgi:DNA-binding FadR family transcriptional regulator